MSPLLLAMRTIDHAAVANFVSHDRSKFIPVEDDRAEKYYNMDTDDAHRAQNKLAESKTARRVFSDDEGRFLVISTRLNWPKVQV